MLRPGRGAGSSGGGGGGGFYGRGGGYPDQHQQPPSSGSSGVDVGLGGASGYGYGNQHQQQYNNDQNVFKDKPRRNARRGSFVAVASFLSSPVFWVGLLAILFAGLAYSYRSQQGRFLKLMKVKSLDDITAKLDDKELQIERLQESERRTNARLQDMEQKHKELTSEISELHEEIDELHENHSDARDDHADELEEVHEDHKERETEYKEMLFKIQESTQRFSRRAVMENFGNGPHKVQFTAKLPSDQSEVSFTVETAPLDLMPHSIHLFLEQVKSGLWNSDAAWFYINGPHVLQCGPSSQQQQEQIGQDGGGDNNERELALAPFKNVNLDSLSFPEYASSYPHTKWTIGFTGRPGGPDWYINKQDNTIAHGPGDQDPRELDERADPCFARVVDGFDSLERMFKEPVVLDGEYKNYYQEPVRLVRATILPDPSKESAGGGASQTTNASAGKSPGVQAGQTQQQRQQAQGNQAQQQQARNTAQQQAPGQMNQQRQQQKQANKAQQQAGNTAPGQMDQQQQAQANQAQQQNVGVDGNPVAPNANNGGEGENKRPPHFVKVNNQVEA